MSEIPGGKIETGIPEDAPKSGPADLDVAVDAPTVHLTAIAAAWDVYFRATGHGSGADYAAFKAALAAALPFLERATRHKIAAEIETHAGALVDVPEHSLPVREGVKVWPERQAGGYTQAIGEVLELIGVARGGEAMDGG